MSTTKNTNKKVTKISDFYIQGDRIGFRNKQKDNDTIDYRFMVQIRWESSRDCMGRNCGDGPCRCEEIEETWIEDDQAELFSGVYLSVLNAIKTKNLTTNRKVKADQFLNTIHKYCIERLCVHHNVHNKDLYDIDVVGGYYGQEIGSVTFENQKELNDDILYILNTCKNDIERIKFILEKEYAYLLDSIENVTQCDIEYFNVKDIAKNSIELTRIKNNDNEYFIELDPKSMPIGIIHNNVLIDGHNRTKKILGDIDTNKECCYIVLS
ncbi:hypothetical protein PBI_SCTP2_484 [Salicola phage SCTP-2]|nr:hypothetical protein PBI_SCTP2_484 [Salicola phage SCTP-2]